MEAVMRNDVVKRKTNETDVSAEIDLDGSGRFAVETGVGFLDHMLILFAKHGSVDLKISCLGDLNVDAHHTVEDIGIVLGKAINGALGSREGINRYGSSRVPMDDALADVALDLGNRPYLVFNAELTCPSVGDMDSELFREFFRALAYNSGMTLHINLVYGMNNHHMIEAVFKAFARAFKEAAEINNDIRGVMSTKGMI
jgi:imidazoleglycerol-phosphate dehydratase